MAEESEDQVLAKVPVTLVRDDGRRHHAHLLRLRDARTGDVSTVLPFGYFGDPSVSHELYEALEHVANEINNASRPVRSGSGFIHPNGAGAREVRFAWSASRPEPYEPEGVMHPDTDALPGSPLRGP
ncbi:MAG: hypothetical protein K2X49_19640 [Acetobacteraceae bacterium]|nr:hypothetical protein [Acetobacteraceae bacterium]